MDSEEKYNRLKDELARIKGNELQILKEEIERLKFAQRQHIAEQTHNIKNPGGSCPPNIFPFNPFQF